MEEVKKILNDHEERITKLEKMLLKIPTTKLKKISLKEFILSKKPKDHNDRTLTICYCLEKYKNVTPFNIKDVENGYHDAREKLPSNLSDKIYINAKKGFIMPAKEKKNNLLAWVVTNLGEKYVENNFKM